MITQGIHCEADLCPVFNKKEDKKEKQKEK